MKKYITGGYVRDVLMGRTPHDKDYVVVGSSVQEMLDSGYKQVGKEFPVFLHPETKDEYALARTEKKTGNKHTDFAFDFSPDVTLRQDCLRRDFTCNALALDEETGEITDFFGGVDDIKNKLIRIIDVENFKQDPLRILRAYRFAAILDFEVESHTKEALRQMVADGMLQHLSPERVWMEVEKALQPFANSAKFFEGLAEIEGLHDWFPEIEALLSSPEQKKYHASENTFKHTMYALTKVKEDSSLIKWAVLNHDIGKGTTAPEFLPHHPGHDERGLPLINTMCGRLHIPNEYRRFALLFCRQHMRIAKLFEMKLPKQYDVIKIISDGFHSRFDLERFLRCFYADYFGEEVLSEYADTDTFNAICDRARTIFNIMKGVTLDDLSPSCRRKLFRYKGKRVGIIYREYMIKYLANSIDDAYAAPYTPPKPKNTSE